MKENFHVRQIPGEKRRRWFSSKNLDLIVWHNADNSFAGFELCYDKTLHEHSLFWHPDRGLVHAAIDDGEHHPGRYKSAPIHVADGVFDAQHIRQAFLQESQLLPKEIVEYVLQIIEKHPGFMPPPVA